MTLTYSSEARDQIRTLPPEVKRGIREALEQLAEDPYLGKPLRQELAGFWTLAFKRYRIIYRLLDDKKEIRIYLVALRSRVYEDLVERRLKFK